jgi:aryl-phospho-beta-D-glucosidase BglC (GH1 family)
MSSNAEQPPAHAMQALSLQLDFVARRYCSGHPLEEQPLDQLARFSRASLAGIWQDWLYRQVTADTPRLGSGGLLLEPAATNLVRHYNNPAAWAVPLTGAVNGAHGPDGRCSAFVTASDGTVAEERIALPADTAEYSLSLYLKPLQGGQGRVHLPGCGLPPQAANAHEDAWYDFASGAFGAGMRGPWRAEFVPGGWTRLSVQQANDGSHCEYLLRLGNDPGARILVGGIQLERGRQPTSLIGPGLGESRSRAEERLLVAHGPWSEVAGSLRVDADPGISVRLTEAGLEIDGQGRVRRVDYLQGAVAQPTLELMAMNIAGAEFGGTMPGDHGTHYTWPREANFVRYQGLGVSLVRLPFRWERIQHQLFGELDEAEMQRFVGALDGVQAAGMRVLLDMHNYYQRVVDGQYLDIGSQAVSVDAWIDAWLRLVARVGGHPAIWGLGLMNEPMGTQGRWAEGAQRCVDALRAVDAQTPIIIAGDGFSSAQFWEDQNGAYFPLRGEGLIYEAHLYLDRDTSGRYEDRDEDIHPNKGIFRAQPYFNWLKVNGQRGFIGELGVPHDMPKAMAAMDRVLAYAVDNQVPVFYWAGGSQWNPGHETACEYDGELLPQVDRLAAHRRRVDDLGPVGEPDEPPSLEPEEPEEPGPVDPEPTPGLKVATQYNPMAHRADVVHSGAAQTAYAFRFPFFIGGGDVTELVLSFSNWYLPGSSTGLASDTGNPLPVQAVSVEINGVVQPVTFAGQRAVTLVDGANDVQADPLPPSAFGLTLFDNDAMGWIKGVIQLQGEGQRVPSSWRTTHDFPGSRVLVFDPASTSLSSVDAAGVFAHQGVDPQSRDSGYCPLVLGRHAGAASKALFMRGDGLSSNYGDSAMGRGSGWFQRMLSLYPVKPASINFAVSGATARCGVDEPRVAAHLAYAPDGGALFFGSTELGPHGASGSAQEVFDHLLGLIEQCRGAGVSGKIAVACLLPRASSTDRWATEANQQVSAGWGRDDPPARFNAMLKAYDFDLVYANDVVRGDDDPCKWKASSTPVAFDEMNPAAAGAALLAEACYRTPL